MRKILLALGILLGSIVAASAQCTGVFPNNTACGNVSGSASPPGPVATSNIIPSGTVIGPQACTANEWISSLSSSGTIVCTQPSFSNINGTATIAQGGTGATSASGAFSNLAPTPTRAGDVMYWNGTAWVTLAGNNSSTQVFTENSSGVPSWSTAGSGTITAVVAGYGMTGGGSSGSVMLTFAPCTPQRTVYTSGSGTYTVPGCQGQGPLYIDVTIVGGGGGGGGGGTSGGGTGGNGGASCVSLSGAACTSPVYDAGGGSGGTPTAQTGGTGGTVSGSGTCDDSVAGSNGTASQFALSTVGNDGVGGNGGNSTRTGAGVGVDSAAGVAAATNSGSGGGGGSNSVDTTADNGSGGGAGATCWKRLTSPASSYTYAVGSAGAGGTAGTSGYAGGAGGAGSIIFDARWQ